ncbi:Pfs NACHT and Ankyrin domain protein [Penicillium herquei]|nr:Pfs NACHT and Ankyrin domain protein [Penicillium herquei]
MPDGHHKAGHPGQEAEVTELLSYNDRKRSRGDTDTDGDSPTPSTSKRRRPDDDFASDNRRHQKSCTPVTLSPGDYTVSWICALPIEMAAAKAMLDTVHAPLPNSRNDTNTYTLGNIAMHNIIIACLPSGHYGTNNAATVASNMRRSFPSIRIGLIVGIGGGVPGKADIRLGDVVVSDKGVLQFDLGKAVGEGHFRRTGTLNRPPHALLTAVAKLRADHASKPSQMPSILSKMLEQYPQMTKYTHRGLLEDRLFDGTYDHSQSMDSCEDCDTTRLVSRPTRRNTDPEIHYGAIASGNQVMRSGKIRDQLAEELDVMCFEMEAAGVMDSFPCLVIRGICDYSDSHKNKQWQEYAAATAAAYAKELLFVTPASGVRKTSKVLSADTDRQTNLLKSLKFEQIDARISSIKPNHVETCQWLLTHSDYLDWLDSKKAVEHHGFLWIKGKPGAGKSTLMNFAYKQATKNKAGTVIYFFFNARGDVLERSTAGMYRSLLFQLLNALPRLIEVLNGSEHKDKLVDLYESIVTQSRHPKWPVDVLQGLLRSAIAKIDQRPLTIFVDALDECDADQVEEIVEYFEDLGRCAVSSGIRLNICFSSRHYPHIDVQYGRKLSLELQEGHEKDIVIYIQRKLKVGKSKAAEEIRTKMREKAGGIFMWVVLVTEILNTEYKGGRIFDVRKRLDAIPIKLSDLFREILWRDRNNLHDLQLCIQWILFAKRPLKLEEYYFAAVSGLSSDELRPWDPEDVTRDDMSRFVLSSSKGLAETTKSKGPTVQFIHESVREFFLKDGLRELWPDLTADFEILSHGQLQQSCHAYLKLDISAYVPFGEPLPKASSDTAKDLRSSVSDKFPFLEYATRHVLYHANAAAEAFPQDRFLKDFNLEAWINLDNLFQIYNSRRHTPTASLLYILAENNLAKLIGTALRLDSRINIQGERHQYPLFAALANGHRDAVKALFQKEASCPQNDISAQLEYGGDLVTRKGQTPLFWAIQHGHKAVVEVLLDMDKVDVDANAEDKTGRTQLSWAAENGHKAVVELLLARDALDVNTKDKNRGRTPLLWAAEAGHVAVVKLLLARDGVDVNTKDNSFGQTPLSWAAKNGHIAVVKLLLARDGVDVNTKDENNRTPLLLAARNGHEAVVELLLARDGVDVDTKDNSFDQTPLSWAAEAGHVAVVKLLLARDGVDVNTKDNSFGQTPLSWAAKNGHIAVVKLLLARDGVDVNTKDENNRTPLLLAASDGHEAVVELLLARDGVTVDTKDNSFGQTPLSWAAKNGHIAVVKLLLARDGVDVNTKDENNRTPLLLAARNGHEAVVKLLLARDGITIDEKDNEFDKTPLSWAAQNGHKAVVKLLLDTGNADVNVTDKDGRTPLLWAAQNGHEAVVELLLARDGLDVNAKDNRFDQTPLSWAAKNGHEAVVELLLARDGLDVNAKDNRFDQTPLSWAAKNGHEAVVKLLLARDGVTVDEKDNGVDQTLLLWAAENGHVAMVKLLLTRDAVDVNTKDKNYDRTSLSRAAQNGHEAVVKLLLDTGNADVNVTDKDGRTPLMWATMNRNQAIIKLLLARDGIDIEAKDPHGQTPLLWATANSQESMVKLLLDTGNADINVRNNYGRTPLLWAAANGNLPMVKLLLTRDGIDVEAKDNNGQTPLLWAAKHGHEAVVRLLQSTK